MHNQTVNEKSARGVAWTATLAAATLIVAVAAFRAKHDKSRQDAFLRGDVSESQIIRNVRHALLMLPEGLFDDLAFKVEGNTVTLLGAVSGANAQYACKQRTYRQQEAGTWLLQAQSQRRVTTRSARMWHPSCNGTRCWANRTSESP